MNPHVAADHHQIQVRPQAAFVHLVILQIRRAVGDNAGNHAFLPQRLQHRHRVREDHAAVAEGAVIMFRQRFCRRGVRPVPKGNQSFVPLYPIHIAAVAALAHLVLFLRQFLTGHTGKEPGKKAVHIPLKGRRTVLQSLVKIKEYCFYHDPVAPAAPRWKKTSVPGANNAPAPPAPFDRTGRRCSQKYGSLPRGSPPAKWGARQCS